MLVRDIPAEDRYAGLDEVSKLALVNMQLQRFPESSNGFGFVLRPDKQIEMRGILREKIRGNVSTEVTGRTGYKDGHTGQIPAFSFSLPLPQRLPAQAALRVWIARRLAVPL